MKQTAFTTVEEYIKAQPRKIKKLLTELRTLIKKNAPRVQESISYNMPAYKLEGRPLVYFAAYENHIGFYPMPSAIKKFQKEIAFYKNAKGSLQLPLEEPLPEKLISGMVKFRVKENLAKTKIRKSP